MKSARPTGSGRLFLTATTTALILTTVAPALAQFTPDTFPLDPITGIPAPGPIPIRPRLLTAYGTLIAAALLTVLYLYRTRRFILYWLASLLLLTAALAITSVVSAAVPGALVNGGALLCLTLSAGLMHVAAEAFPDTPVRWRNPLRAAAAFTGWFVVGPLVMPFPLFVDSALLVTALLLAWSAWRYIRIARQTRFLGGLVIGIGLGVVSGGIAIGVAIALGAEADRAVANRVAVTNVITSLFIALGMLLLVFEEVTEELRRSNRDLAVASETARRLAITDPLTGCHNRRFFDEIERRELNQAKRQGTRLSVIFVDVNRFKQLNDSLGHDRGDAALRSVGSMLRHQVRESDYVIRWGGDEFVLLLTSPLQVAQRTADRLKSALGEHPETAELASWIGLSVGVAEAAPDALSLRDAIREADARMYRDKLDERTSLQVR